MNYNRIKKSIKRKLLEKVKISAWRFSNELEFGRKLTAK